MHLRACAALHRRCCSHSASAVAPEYIAGIRAGHGWHIDLRYCKDHMKNADMKLKAFKATQNSAASWWTCTLRQRASAKPCTALDEHDGGAKLESWLYSCGATKRSQGSLTIASIKRVPYGTGVVQHELRNGEDQQDALDWPWQLCSAISRIARPLAPLTGSKEQTTRHVMCTV